MTARRFASSGSDPASSGRKRVIAISALGQLETIQPNSRRGRFTLNSGLDGSAPIRSFDARL
jgi:hypothetical protein